MRGIEVSARSALHEVVQAHADVGAVVPELGAGDHDLPYALGLALLGLFDHPGNGLRALTATGLGDDAEGADVVAAFLSGDEGAGAVDPSPRPPPRWRRGGERA